MTCDNKKSTRPILAYSLTMLVFFSGMYGIQHTFADTENNFVTFTGDDIKNNPTLAKILENIEKSKKEFSDIQQKINQEKLLDEQRNVAKTLLDQQLQQMFKDNEDFTPINAFSKFLKTVPDDDTKTIFKGLFDYQQEKVSAAREAMRDVIRNGGTLQEARDTYHETAKIPRVDMIKLVKDLNIGVGFSDPDIQKHFDDDGKLPRYDNVQESVLSFVDFTTSVKNVNSSTNATDIEEITQSLDNDDATNDADDSEKTIIQKLLEEIQFLKSKINQLETKQNGTIQQAVFEQNDSDPTHFADWVLDYSQGLGHGNSPVQDIKSIPVNALNEPNSHNDADNSLALGRQGQVILGFSEPVTDKLIVYEASTEKNIRELATVEVSKDGENWTLLKQTHYSADSSNVHEYGYDLSDIGCIVNVRITDNAPSKWGDGFDVDAVGATHTCTDTA